MEPTEINNFSMHMKEAGGEESLTHISLAIPMLAVRVAMVTVLGHRSHTEAVLIQGRATDQWNEYQAKRIREDNLSVTIDTLQLASAASPAVQSKVAEYQAHIAKWKLELAEEEEKAREYESEVGHGERQAGRYDLGEALLQIAVVLASLTLFTRNKRYFIFGLSLDVAGLIVAISSFLVH